MMSANSEFELQLAQWLSDYKAYKNGASCEAFKAAAEAAADHPIITLPLQPKLIIKEETPTIRSEVIFSPELNRESSQAIQDIPISSTIPAAVNNEGLKDSETLAIKCPSQPYVAEGETKPFDLVVDDKLTVEDTLDGEIVPTVSYSAEGFPTTLQHEHDMKQEAVLDDPVLRPYQCHVCFNRYSHLNHLQAHQRVHTVEKPFSCRICHKRFGTSAGATSHELKHSNSGERRYQCTVCHKKFITSANVKVHMRTHTGEKPFECTVCFKRFTQAGNLKRHVKTHEGDM